jgi:hypothetical protein
VAVAARQLGDAQAVGFDQPGARLPGTVQKLAHARIAARGLVIDFNDGLRRGFQAHAHGMEAEEDFGAGHGAIIRCA